MAYGLSTRAAMIATCYSRYLGRYPDMKGFDLLLSSDLDEAGVANILAGSNECVALERAIKAVAEKLAAYPGRKKVLLLGAYGNGNLGDREMAGVIARELEEQHGVVCFAHSPIAAADYSFAEARKLDAALQPLNPRVLLLFDALIIGGGGFLAWPHDPVWTPSWAYLVPIPYAILSIGAGHPLDERVHNLVAQATNVSGRDYESVKALAGAKPQAEFCPDPILSLITATLPPKPASKPFTRLFVLRGARTPWHDKIRQEIRDNDLVILFEAKNDVELFEMFPRAHLARSMEVFAHLAAEADLIVTERYHGAILALVCGKPAIGVYRGDHNASKLVSLFAALGIEKYCGTDPHIPDQVGDYPLNQVAGRIQAFASVFKERCSSLMKQLFAS